MTNASVQEEGCAALETLAATNAANKQVIGAGGGLKTFNRLRYSDDHCQAGLIKTSLFIGSYLDER